MADAPESYRVLTRRGPDLTAGRPRPPPGTVPKFLRPYLEHRELSLAKKKGNKGALLILCSPFSKDKNSYFSFCPPDAQAIQPIRKALREPLRPCLLYTSPSPRDRTRTRMTSSA